MTDISPSSSLTYATLRGVLVKRMNVMTARATTATTATAHTAYLRKLIRRPLQRDFDFPRIRKMIRNVSPHSMTPPQSRKVHSRGGAVTRRLPCRSHHRAELDQIGRASCRERG